MPRWTLVHTNNSFSSEHFSTLLHNSNLHALLSPTEHVALTTSMVPLDHCNSLFLNIIVTHSFFLPSLSFAPFHSSSLPLSSLSCFPVITFFYHKQKFPCSLLKDSQVSPCWLMLCHCPLTTVVSWCPGGMAVPREIRKCIFTLFFFLRQFQRSILLLLQLRVVYVYVVYVYVVYVCVFFKFCLHIPLYPRLFFAGLLIY